MSTSNRIIKPGYESYQPVVVARQFGLGQVSPHFFLHHLTESRAELPDVLTGQRCYSFFDALAIPIPHNLHFISSTDGFETWWSMWKTHAFRRALGPLLKQLDAEYDIPAEQVPLLTNFLQWFVMIACHLTLFPCSNKMVQNLYMRMAPPSSSFLRLPWFSSARAHHL
jgi:hypothetical protein